MVKVESVYGLVTFLENKNAIKLTTISKKFPLLATQPE
jgi:hypothetical protein